MAPGRPGHARLLQDLDVKRWHDSVARRSHVTADVYLRRLGAFFIANGTTPKKFAGLREREACSVIMDLVTKEQQRDIAGSYIQSRVCSAIVAPLFPVCERSLARREIRVGPKGTVFEPATPLRPFNPLRD